ncbi:phosphatidylinositol 4,5-bisphosphate 3-kinase catalytic subunit gamma isoform [Latimeria chalumnae]|uniref:Si:rp71-17i16.5 n=1 Tax=Latimeria chalumnae TaxID=7897 RepID=H3AT86_LATCH|nr:PREDICTED: phosphatidylinositol 4,5-bisphosphate 3-kinase catalytic subunit gamma isoform-like [Latimeria chalumnae]XP_014350198.1 PREDICTED: phosphatidylinositol 4,5-bisphosphate 3-kinase catalytic subunit gamma isoform-like [Latimeria chalumnae]|eukprot:XP_006006332.2 PREDICTED: phosphatidylinositol 4,5-bisphosphate 3-kinase catalytic subunit gamma isoform-like [Latimeria chalumnae]
MEIPETNSQMKLPALQCRNSNQCNDFLGDLSPKVILSFICVLPTKKPNDGVNEVVTVEISAHSTVRNLRLLIWMQARDISCQKEFYKIVDPAHCKLLYQKEKNWYEIYDDYQTLDSIRYWRYMGMEKGQIYVHSKLKETKEQEDFQKRLTYLIGYDIGIMSFHGIDELSFARRKLASPRQTEIKQRDPWLYAMEPWITSVPFPENIKAWIGEELVVVIYYMGESNKMKVNINHTPSAIAECCVQRLIDKDIPVGKKEQDLVLKVCGREEYLTGDRPLVNFLWIRHCLKSKQEVHLSLIPVPSFEDDDVTTEDWPLVDEFTGLTGTHENLQLGNQESDEITMISLWDCARKFRMKIIGIDIPNLPTKAPQQVYIEASILHGRNILSSVISKIMPFTEEVIWNSWLEFNTLVKNLPKGSKLHLSVNGIDNEYGPLKESKSSCQGFKDSDALKNKSKLLYFVNILLIDHRSLLQQGEHVLHMWPYQMQEAGLFTNEAERLSSKTNPEIETSMAISIIFDSYCFPLALPYSKTSKSSSFSRPSTYQHQSKSKSMEESMLPNPVTVSGKESLRRFSEESARYGTSLPRFLSTINWGDMEAVQDLHWLLQHWDPHNLDIVIALELLSINFADEKIRKMSVDRLEELQNDELMRYLLQLVQALKFEPYHDSALARFLIRRALRSKRIGHFFFWYLRSEITGSPYFCDHFAVILEAYLMGCGKSMLEGFSTQVQLVECLHQVVTDIKKIIPEESNLPASAAAQLQERLKMADLPQDFLVPFDPRIKAGTILLNNCKIMASKKKPLWLEFTCSETEAINTPPVGIIFKHGDDLRQDMLIIQTLVVMDSIWQENSLDLNLIPYGCISTGYRIGMIEIVRDAKTIATVQRSKGGTLGAFKNDALYDWLKSKCKIEEMHYQALERFVTSCAGYCVATYVLGIGDRHNDNIMITEYGNLFHIDFGHILGNTKRFLGMNRERVPFVLTPDFLFVMGRVNRKSSLYFQRFKDICIQAYQALRCHSNLLITLFSLMMLTRIPELSCTRDIEYLKEALALGRDDQSAKDHFLNQISICENLDWTVQTNWWIHMVMGMK